MFHTTVLIVHIAAGVTGLALGLPALQAVLAGRPSGSLRRGYEVAVTVLAASAVLLAVLDWNQLWPFAVIAALTEAALVGAGRAGRSERAGARARQFRLLGGSYVSLVTALFVVSWGSVAAWLLPGLVGTVLLERAVARVDARPA